MNNFEKIKNMTLDEMAKFMTELLCQECDYIEGDYHNCNQIGCWCHKNNGYLTYKQWLQAESEG